MHLYPNESERPRSRVEKRREKDKKEEEQRQKKRIGEKKGIEFIVSKVWKKCEWK